MEYSQLTKKKKNTGEKLLSKQSFLKNGKLRLVALCKISLYFFTGIRFLKQQQKKTSNIIIEMRSCYFH